MKINKYASILLGLLISAIWSSACSDLSTTDLSRSDTDHHGLGRAINWTNTRIEISEFCCDHHPGNFRLYHPPPSRIDQFERDQNANQDLGLDRNCLHGLQYAWQYHITKCGRENNLYSNHCCSYNRLFYRVIIQSTRKRIKCRRCVNHEFNIWLLITDYWTLITERIPNEKHHSAPQCGSRIWLFEYGKCPPVRRRVRTNEEDTRLRRWRHDARDVTAPNASLFSRAFATNQI